MQMIPIIELCRYSPGMVTALGVSMGLTAARDHVARHRRAEGALGAAAAHAREDRRLGHHRARLRLRRVRRHEVDRAPRRRRLRAQRQQDLHHQRPVRRHHRLHLQARRGQRRREASARSSQLHPRQGHARAHADRSRCARWACTRRRPASSSSTTCASARIGSSARPRTSPARSGAKETFTAERTGVAAMALGIVEQCLQAVASSTRRRACSSASPIGEFQLIQLKLAKMEVARMNIQNMVFRQIEMAAAGKSMSLAEASACKLYCGAGGDGRLPRGGAALRRQRLHGRVPASSSSAATPRCCRSTAAPTRSRSRRSPVPCLS